MLIVDQLRKDDRRLRTLALIVLAGLGVLLVGLWYVQIVCGRRYQSSLETQTFRTVRLPAVRGKVLDRNGFVLAENRPQYNLDLYIEELRPLFDQEFTRLRAGRKLPRAARLALLEQARYNVVSNCVRQVSMLFQQPLGLSERGFRRHHDQWPYRPLPVLANLNPLQVARFLEQGQRLPGMEVETQPLRYYPYGPTVAHLLGYLTRDDLARDEEEGGFNYSLPSFQGAVGMEHAFDKELSGQPGVKSLVVNSLCYREKDKETLWATPEPGQNVVLTLDLPIQKAAFDALRSAGATVRGATVVMDSQTGDVLALVSSPAYDPNEFLAPIPAERWRDHLNDPVRRPMFNRATQGAYQPGSIFKIITALACLEAGVLSPTTLTNVFTHPGFYRLGNRRIKDTAPPGDYDFRRAFKRSSNAYFINYGLKAGRDKLLRMGHRFHLGERIGLTTRQETGGYFPESDDVEGVWGDGNTANLCIGQEITVTPLQMAVLTAAIANGGKVMWPRFVLRVEPPEAGLEETRTNYWAPRVRSELGIPAQHLEIVREAMLADTEEHEGTGFEAFHQSDRATPVLKGFRVGGKTGTAQVTDLSNRVIDHITWFTAFGPYENPRFVVVVMVEGGGSGGGTCAPLARQVFQAIQKRLGSSRPPGARLAGTN
jgi:penicillin-binding protein 2